MLKADLNKLPPVVTKYLSNNGDGLYAIYTHAWRRESGCHGESTVYYGKVLLSYSQDFCGGIEVRSCHIGTTHVKLGSWGWSNTVLGTGATSDNEKDVEKAFPILATVPEFTHEYDDGDAERQDKQLVLNALAARVLMFAAEAQRAGIIGRDRLWDSDWDGDRGDWGVKALMEAITPMSRWSNWSIQGFCDDYCIRHSMGDSLSRRLHVVPFFNFNSENNVGVYVSAVEDGEDYNIEQFEECAWSRDTHAIQAGSIGETLVDKCPTAEWCVG